MKQNLWSHAVTTRLAATFPPPGIYTRTAREIYLAMRRPSVSPNGLASAIQMVQFFINRAGRSLPEPRKRVLRKSIEYLRVELQYLKQHETFELSAQPKAIHPPPDKRIGGRHGNINALKHQELRNMEITSLADFFGAEITTDPGLINLRKFAAQFKDEVKLDEEGRCVRFSTEDNLFVIRCDMDGTDGFKTVYQGFIKSFCPEKTLAYTDYETSIHAVLDELKRQWTELHKES